MQIIFILTKEIKTKMREFCAGRETSDVTCHGGKNGTYCRI
jgi:hypothetical protein